MIQENDIILIMNNTDTDTNTFYTEPKFESELTTFRSNDFKSIELRLMQSFLNSVISDFDKLSLKFAVAYIVCAVIVWGLCSVAGMPAGDFVPAVAGIQ